MKRKAVVLSMTLALLLFGVTAGFSQVAPATLYYFPQLAAGQSGTVLFENAYALINPGSTAAQVKIEFFDDAGSPLTLEFTTTEGVNLGIKTSVDITLPPNATRAMSADNSLPGGSHAPLKTGWAKVTSSVPIWALGLFLLHGNGTTLGAVGVPPVTPQQQFTIFAIRESVDVAIAIANPSDTAATITATLFDLAGLQLAQVPISVGPRGHTAKFSREMFPSGPDEFTGKIVVSSTTPFLMMNLYFDGAVMASLPVFVP